MSHTVSEKKVYLDLSIDDNDFGFATSIDDTLTQAETELLVLNETVDSINELKSYELAVIELCERIKRIIDENKMLNEAIVKIKTFGTDYRKMTEGQQYELGAYVNLMEAATMLLVNPITGLQPKFSEEDFDKVCAFEDRMLIKKSKKNRGDL